MDVAQATSSVILASRVIIVDMSECYDACPNVALFDHQLHASQLPPVLTAIVKEYAINWTPVFGHLMSEHTGLGGLSDELWIYSSPEALPAHDRYVYRVRLCVCANCLL